MERIFFGIIVTVGHKNFDWENLAKAMALIDAWQYKYAATHPQKARGRPGKASPQIAYSCNPALIISSVTSIFFVELSARLAHMIFPPCHPARRGKSH
jgi:hypothetical protein